MGQHKYHRNRRELWLRQDQPGLEDHSVTQSAVGHRPIYGNLRVRELGMSALMFMKDSFYKVLTPEQSAMAFRNEFDFDSPSAVDFDILVDRLQSLKQGWWPPTPDRWQH